MATGYLRLKQAGLQAMAAGILFLAAAGSAQTVPTGYQDYYVTGNDEQVWRMFNLVAAGEGQPAWSGQAYSIVGVAASADNQRITYDHWEGGYEANILAPVQANTLVLGDNNPASGGARSFTNNPRLTSDCLLRGTVLTFSVRQKPEPVVTITPTSGRLVQMRHDQLDSRGEGAFS